jgi:TonB family protein
LVALQPHAVPQESFTHEDVVYYSPSEYLPPLDTRPSTAAPAAKADPEYSAQAIISVPPEADNRTQTVVTPPNVRLQHDVALPNFVSVVEKMFAGPRMPIAPAPAIPASEISRLAPRAERSVIAPPAALDAVAGPPKPAQSPQVAVIAPPPSVETESQRRLGDLTIARSSIIAPAPALPMNEQRAFSGKSASVASRQPSPVIAPPPEVSASGSSHSGRNMVALNLHPAVGAPPDPPPGNRRGNFAATPQGHRGASGATGVVTEGSSVNGAGFVQGKSNAAGLPSGLYVGKVSNTDSPVAGDPTAKSAYSVNPNLIASARPLRAPRALQTESDNKLSQEERAVFGGRKFYSLSLNMPNLNSAGGSWIIRFAALKPDSHSADSYSREDASLSASPAGLSAPSATRKVDPAYPLELMRQNIGGLVILYGVIHADGTVGSVRVLRGADDRLDRFASEAIAKWQFDPATKNGTPVDVEATFSIPFHPVRPNF